MHIPFELGRSRIIFFSLATSLFVLFSARLEIWLFRSEWGNLSHVGDQTPPQRSCVQDPRKLEWRTTHQTEKSVFEDMKRSVPSWSQRR
jgi:hypothetical protein